MKRFPFDLSQTEKVAIGAMVGLLALAVCFILSLFAYAWLSPPAPEIPMPAQQPVPPSSTPAPTTTPISDTPTPYPTNTETPTATPVVPPTFTHTPTAIIALPTSTLRLITSTPQAAPTQVQAACDCSSDVYNCSDFTSWNQAQQCFEYCLDQGRGDVHDLDRDKDLIVCESDR